jgi:hypothetical protein
LLDAILHVVTIGESGKVFARSHHLVLLLMLDDYSETDARLFYDIAVVMISSKIFEAIKQGFHILTTLVNQGVGLEVTPPLIAKILELAGAPGHVLDRIFEFIANRSLGCRAELISCLLESGFFHDLRQRVLEEEHDEGAPYIFRLFMATDWVPEPGDPFLIAALHYLTNGAIPARMSALKYLHELLMEYGADFCVFLAQNGILVALRELLTADIDGLIVDVIHAIEKVVHTLVALDIDLESVEGIDELGEELTALEGKDGGMYDRAISAMLEEIGAS